MKLLVKKKNYGNNETNLLPPALLQRTGLISERDKKGTPGDFPLHNITKSVNN
jgi:hypothetical protein